MRLLERFFPAWVLLFATFAYFRPDLFLPLRPAIVPLLALIMLGMGLSLSFADFAAVFRQPREVIAGVAAQYTIMPLSGYGLAMAFGLEPDLAAGVVLLGSCPGGLASNVISYLARADVPLSVTLTASSTVLAPVVTPLLTKLLVGRMVPVPAYDLLVEIAKIVLLPVLVGLALRRLCGALLNRTLSIFPLFSMATIALVVAIITAANVGSNSAALKIAPRILAVVVLHNLSGYWLGYLAARLLRLGERQRRAISIEVGMQNSGLAAALSLEHFSAAAALPGAIFSVWHNLSGPALAAYWASKSAAREMALEQARAAGREVEGRGAGTISR